MKHMMKGQKRWKPRRYVNAADSSSRPMDVTSFVVTARKLEISVVAHEGRCKMIPLLEKAGGLAKEVLTLDQTITQELTGTTQQALRRLAMQAAANLTMLEDILRSTMGQQAR